MMQQIIENHWTNEDGTPTGGTTSGTGIDIQWQNGALREQGLAVGEAPRQIAEPNGAFVEGVIAAAIGRLEHYQKSKFRCRENALAITKLQEALHWLDHRTRDREDQGIEGTHETRESEGYAT